MSSRDRRRYRRAHILWPAKFWHGEIQRECIVMNLSLNGAKLRWFANQDSAGRFKPKKGDLITLDLDGYGLFRGHMVWSAGKNLGLQFEESPEAIQAALGTLISRLQLCLAE